MLSHANSIFFQDNGVDDAYVKASWIEHPNADFQRDTVTAFLTDGGLLRHVLTFYNMGVVSGDDLLNLCLEMRAPEIRLKVKEALRLDGAEWFHAKAVLSDFARPVVWLLD